MSSLPSLSLHRHSSSPLHRPVALTISLTSLLVGSLAAGCTEQVAAPADEMASGELQSTAPAGEALPPLPALSVAALQTTTAEGSVAAAGRPGRPPRTTDPLFSAVLGHWKGECNIYLPGVAEPAFSVGVERISELTGNPGEISWTLIYLGGPITPDVRNYTMRADPAQPGRYVLDENNGILLTNYMHGDDLMINDFEGLGFRLRGREEYRQGRYDFEFVTSEVTPEIASEVGGVTFYAYRVISTQRCSMRRVNRGH